MIIDTDARVGHLTPRQLAEELDAMAKRLEHVQHGTSNWTDRAVIRLSGMRYRLEELAQAFYRAADGRGEV